MIAPMSSTIASVSRNSRSADGIRRPSNPSTPTAKAMSVAIGMPQPALASPPPAIEGIEPGRDEHAADRGDDRQGGGPRVPEVTADELVLDLQPHDEEEDHHQRVIDPVLQGLLEPEVADLDADRGVPEGVVRRRHRTVRPDQRDDGRHQQEHRAGGLDAQELADRPGHESGQRSCCWRGRTGRRSRRRRRRGRRIRGGRSACAAWLSGLGTRFRDDFASRADQTSRLTCAPA